MFQSQSEVIASVCLLGAAGIAYLCERVVCWTHRLMSARGDNTSQTPIPVQWLIFLYPLYFFSPSLSFFSFF